MQDPRYRAESLTDPLHIALLQDDEDFIEGLQPFKKCCEEVRPAPDMDGTAQILIDYLFTVCSHIFTDWNYTNDMAHNRYFRKGSSRELSSTVIMD